MNLNSINIKLDNPLLNNELLTISNSILKYWNNDSIKFGSIKNDENINIGVMGFEKMANLATKLGVNGSRLKVHTPLIAMTKSEIIQTGINLGVDYSKTISCYDPIDDKSCGLCDSCRFRVGYFTYSGERYSS